MTYSCKMLSTLILLFCASAVFAGDLGLDTTFSLQAGAFNTVYDVHVLSDGKVIAAGTACGSSSCTPSVRRLNADGSIDTSFSVQLNPLNQGGGHARYIKPLSNGQFLITGDFNIGTTRSSFVRINADGSIDTTMAPRYLVVADIEPTVDGKYIVCGSGVVNGENYGTAYRLNNDGTSDPSFRITFITGHCGGVRSLADGKFLITANAVSGEPAIKPVHKLNNDGSQDTSFTTDIPAGSTARGLTLLPDGKILVGSYGVGGENVSRLTSTGATEMSTSLCRGDLFVPLPNGDVLTTNCRKWSGAILSLIVARMRPDGTVDPKFDDVYIDVNQGAGLLGFRDAGNGKFYAFGGFGGVNGVYGPSTQYLIRLAPNNTPPRAKFDFDGDGKSDLAVFRPSDRTWYLRQSTLGDAYVVWGLATDRPAATHFDNDGRTNVVVFRNGVWHANSPIFGWIQMNSGVAGDQPIVGNFDDFGLNLEDYAVRGLRSGVVQWSVIQGNLTQPNPSGSGLGVTIGGETISDKPIAGDFNGDSRDEIGYFRNGLWVTTDYFRVQPTSSFQWGSAGDIPVPGDYDGDRQTDYAIFRPSTGDWWINQSSGGHFVIRFGLNGDIPVPADYDGDGKVDIAIYRNGQWWQFLMGTGTIQVVNWGLAGDIPIPAQGQF